MIPSDAAFVRNEIDTGRFYVPTELVGVALKVFRAVYGSKELYDAYIRTELEAAMNDPRPLIPHEKVEASKRKRATIHTHTYTVDLAPTAEGGYSAGVPAFPGLTAEGRTHVEALAEAEDAIERCIDVLQEQGSPVPEGDEPLHEPIRAQVTVIVDPIDPEDD